MDGVRLRAFVANGDMADGLGRRYFQYEGMLPPPQDLGIHIKQYATTFEVCASIPSTPNLLGESTTANSRVIITNDTLVVSGQDYAAVREEFAELLVLIGKFHTSD